MLRCGQSGGFILDLIYVAPAAASDGSALLSWVTTMLTLGALAIAVLSIRSQTRNSRQEKVFDAISESHRRYWELRLTRHDVQKGKEAIYFGQFWSIQMEQWEYFRLGLIPYDVFRFWWITRAKEFEREGHERKPNDPPRPMIGSMTFKEGWQQQRSRYYEDTLPAFVLFVDAVAQTSTECKCASCDTPKGDFWTLRWSSIKNQSEPRYCKYMTTDQLLTQLKKARRLYRREFKRELLE